MQVTRHEPCLTPAESATYPTAEMAQAYLERPNATRVELYLRGERPVTPARPVVLGNTLALQRQHLRALGRAPRLASSDPRLPALGRWQGVKIAHEHHFGTAPTNRGAARRSAERAARPEWDVPPLAIQPAPLTVEVRGATDAPPWRGRYNLVVIDGEALLLPRKVDTAAFRFRAYAGRELDDAPALAPAERAVDAAIRGLVAALQAHLDTVSGPGLA